MKTSRTWIFWLLVAHYANTYLDRVALAGLAPLIREDFGLKTVELGIVFSAFSFSYGLLQVPAGRLADVYGPRRVLTALVCFWSTFTLLTALAWGRFSLAFFRFMLGIGESGAFPGASRAILHWFPATRRGFVQGFTHAGSRLAGAAAPALAAYLASFWGWRIPFVLFALPGFVWAFFWYRIFRDRPEDDPAGDPFKPREKATPAATGRGFWLQLIRNRSVRALCAMYFCYVYVFWIYITWFPTFLVEAYGFSSVESGVLAGVPLALGAVTNGLGGLVSDRLIARLGLTTARRSIAMIGFVLSAIAGISATLASGPVVALIFFSLMVAALEATTGVAWAAAVDIGGKNSGAVSGLMNTFGNLGGAVSPIVFGQLVVSTSSWFAPFVAASAVCACAALLWIFIDPLAAERNLNPGAAVPMPLTEPSPGEP